MDVIRKWLNGSRDYDTGVQLYLEHGQDKKLQRLLTLEGYSEFKNKKLLAALQDLLASPGTSAVITAPAIPAPAINKTLPEAGKIAPDANKLANKATPVRRWSEVRDPVEQALFEAWKPLYAEMLDLVNRVGDVSRNAEQDPSLESQARTMALRVLELDAQCEQIYTKRNYYLENKKLPESKSDGAPDPDPRRWPVTLANHQRYVRDYKSKFAKETDPEKRLKLAAQLKKHEALVDRYKKLLNDVQDNTNQ
jgi:hypothetical protein